MKSSIEKVCPLHVTVIVIDRSGGQAELLPLLFIVIVIVIVFVIVIVIVSGVEVRPSSFPSLNAPLLTGLGFLNPLLQRQKLSAISLDHLCQSPIFTLLLLSS